MKNNFLLLAAFALALPVFSQTTDTTFISVSQETGLLEKPRFIDQYDYLFGTKQPTRFLLKLNVAPIVLPLGAGALEDDFANVFVTPGDFTNISRAELSAEWKVAPALSLHAGVIVPTRGSRYFRGHYRGGGWRVEPRWYYDMARRIRFGQSANNVSGNYFSAEYQTFVQRDQEPEPVVSFHRYRFEAVSLRYGLQRRLGRFAFVDVSLGAGYQQASQESANSTSQTDQSGFFDTRVAAGLAFGAPRTDKSKVPFCDVLRCFQEDRHLWKISLAKALQVNQAGPSSNPKVSYEQKIGNSSFSIETETELFLSAHRDFEQSLQLRNYGAGLNVQPRWYFLQKQRIAKGKSGNNLAGVFAGVLGGYRWTKQVNGVHYVDGDGSKFYVAPHLGMQQRLFRNGFINYKFGVLYSDLLANPYRGIPDPSSFLSELQVGFAF